MKHFYHSYGKTAIIGQNEEKWIKIYHKCQILSGSALKVMALAFMITDHIAGAFFNKSSEMLSICGHTISLYQILRNIGRLAFPIYCFLLIEGFLHTSNRKKYGKNLLLFALISEIPWNLSHSGELFYGSQNVYFTLLLGFLGLCILEKADYSYVKRTMLLFLLLVISILLKADYGVSGYGFILILYILRKDKGLQAIVGSCVLSSRWIAGLAFIPINMYNGKRGFIHNQFLKFLFYAAYPAHLMVLYFLKYQPF